MKTYTHLGPRILTKVADNFRSSEKTVYRSLKGQFTHQTYGLNR